VEDGFVQSFELTDEQKIKEFFARFGFVVINNILTSVECKETIDYLWESIQELSPNIKRDDTSSWENKYWANTGIIEEGIVGYGPIWSQRAFINRQNPKLAKAYSILFDREDLLVNHDRFGLFRPTKGIEIKGQKVTRPSWATKENLHLDMNPWFYCERKSDEEEQKMLASLRYKDDSEFIIENNHVGIISDNKLNIQGLINLADNKEEDGGFQIVPGFSHHLKDWALSKRGLYHKKVYGDRETFIVLDENDPLHKQSIRVTCRAGSAVFWDQRTVHGSRPNESENIRYAQFVKMFPSQLTPEREQGRIKKITEKAKEYSLDTSKFPTSSLKVLGLIPWNDKTEKEEV